jgi:hypothetical protein
MMMMIWKTSLELVDSQSISIPAGAEFLTAREQHGKICVWFRCSPDNPPRPRKIVICGTGHPCRRDDEYIGTAFLNEGAFVLHVFERQGSAT